MTIEKLLVERAKHKHSLELIEDKLVHFTGITQIEELPTPTTDLEGFLKRDFLNNCDMENKINRIMQLVDSLG